MRFQVWQQVFEDGLLDRLAFRCRFDDQVGGADVGQAQRGADARHRGGLCLGRDLATRDLAFDVAVDLRQGLCQAVFADIRHQHVKPRQRKDMRNAAAHLPGPDDANALDVHSAPFSVRPNHMRRPGSDARQGGKNSSRIRGSAFRQPGAAKLESRCAGFRVGGMVITSPDDMTLDYLPCQYGKSKLLVRGPQRPLTGPCCAIPGGPALAAALSRGGLHRVSL